MRAFKLEDRCGVGIPVASSFPCPSTRRGHTAINHIRITAYRCTGGTKLRKRPVAGENMGHLKEVLHP